MNERKTEPTPTGVLKDPHPWRMVAARAWIMTLALPRAYLYGASSSNSGLDLIAHVFKGPERLAMIKTRP